MTTLYLNGVLVTVSRVGGRWVATVGTTDPVSRWADTEEAAFRQAVRVIAPDAQCAA